MKNLIFLFFALISMQTVFAQPDKEKMIYDYPEQMPQYPGGGDAMHHFIADNLVYPVKAREEGISGKVYVSFVVEVDGSITNVEIRRGQHELLNNEAIRLVKSMPNWKPGSIRGKLVRTRYTLPIVFRLE